MLLATVGYSKKINKKTPLTRTLITSLVVASICCLILASANPISALITSNGDFEAESVSNTSSKNIKLYKDSAASGGKALQYYVNGTAARSTITPAVNKITVFARGVQCAGSPLMTVSVDGLQILSSSVANTAYTGFSADVALSSGSHSVQIAFTNDHYVSSSCDRNLIVDKVEFTPGTGAVINPEPEPEPEPEPGACNTSAQPPASTDPGTLVIADGFENGDFSNWTKVTQDGDATAQVQNLIAKTDNCAAKVHVTGNSGSRANFAKTLPANSHEVWATGWFNITREGASTNNNVPTFRFFNGTSRLLDVSRQNGSGVLFVRWPTATGFSWNSTGRTLNTNQWYQIKVHAVANGSASQVRVWLDGTEIFNRTNSTTGYASFGSFTSVSSLQIGAEHVLQDGDFVADDIVAKIL